MPWTPEQSRRWILDNFGEPDKITREIISNPKYETCRVIRDMERRERRMARGQAKRGEAVDRTIQNRCR